MTTYESPHLQKLADLLDARGLPMEPILEAVMVAGSAEVYLAASTLSRRLDLLVPFSDAALRSVAPGVDAPEPPARSMLRISASGEHIDSALVIVGPVEPRAAIDEVAPAGGREAWMLAVEDILRATAGAITSRSRWLTHRRGSIAIQVPPRPEEDDGLLDRLDDVGHVLRIPAMEQEQWKSCARTLVPGEPFTLTTHCTAAGPSANLAMLYRTTSWDGAVQVARVLLDRDNARQSAASLGEVAGILRQDAIKGVEIVLEQRGIPDVVVWLTLR